MFIDKYYSSITGLRHSGNTCTPILFGSSRIVRLRVYGASFSGVTRMIVAISSILEESYRLACIARRQSSDALRFAKGSILLPVVGMI